MPRTVDLDTPFRKGEKVITTHDLPCVTEGTSGKIKLINGLNTWVRYWVLFENGEMLGHLDADDLVRPDQLDEWRAREEQRANADAAEAAAVEAASDDAGGGGDGAAGLIPAHLLERSKAAKAAKLGG